MINQESLHFYQDELEKLQRNFQFVIDSNNLTGDSLFFQLQDNFKRSASTQIEKLISIAYKFEQIAIRLLDDDKKDDSIYSLSKKTFEHSAKLFEQIAEAENIENGTIRLDLYLHSAIDYSLGEFHANATVLANKVLKIFTFEDDIRSKVINACFFLLQHNLIGLTTSYEKYVLDKEEFERQLIQNLDPRKKDELYEIVEPIGHFLSLEAMLSFVKYLRTGNDDEYKLTISKIQTSLEIFAQIRDVDDYVLIHLISHLFRQIHCCSIWNQLGTLFGFQHDLVLNRYLNVLSSDKDRPIYELWDSQIKALPNLLNNNTTVLQMPTSAGKTRIAEIKIVQTLASGKEKPNRCIYVAPFKALVKQIEESLGYYLSKVGYHVTSIFGGYEGIDFEESLAKQSDVLVITPEKLDYLFRQAPTFFDDVKLIVVDEGHIIDDKSRGLHLELLISRINRKYYTNGLRFLFISAVIPNADEIARWLSPDQSNVITTDWKPTTLRQGVFYWGNDDYGRIWYEKESTEFKTGIKHQLIRDYKLKKPTEKLKTPIYAYPNGGNQISVELALNLLKASPTIIFTVVRTQIPSIAKVLHEQIVENQRINPDFSLISAESKPFLDELAKFVESKQGSDSILSVYIRNGFAYHHGFLPDDIKEKIEEAFRCEYIRILIATHTLAQGVNLPVKLMLVANLNSGKDNPFSVRDFRNIAGRAGRALHETEGNLIFVQNTNNLWLVNENSRYFFDYNIEKVESVLFTVFENLIQKTLNIPINQYFEQIPLPVIDFHDHEIATTEEEATFQNQILAMIFEEFVIENDQDSIQSLIDKSLFGVQWKKDRVLYSSLVDYTSHQVKFISKQFSSTAQRKAFYETGFSIQSCMVLEEKIKELGQKEIFAQLRTAESKALNNNNLAEILELISLPDETRSKYPYDKTIIETMICWISSMEVNEIRKKFEDDNPLFHNPDSVSDLIFHHFVYDAPWALNGVVKILNYLQIRESIQVDSEIMFLPSYLKHGVNTPIASYLCEIGITNRIIATIISNHFYSEKGKGFYLPSITEFQEWIDDQSYEDFFDLLHDEIFVKEVWTKISQYRIESNPIRTFLNAESINYRTYVVGLKYENRLEIFEKIQSGELLQLNREPDNSFDSFALAVYNSKGEKLGYIRKNKAFILSTLIDEGKKFSCSVIMKKTRELNPNKKLMVLILFKE